MSRPPQYGDVMRSRYDRSFWMLISVERGPWWWVFPLDGKRHGIYSGNIDGMEYV